MKEIFDDAVLEAFLGQQLKLFPEKVAGTPGEAREFLEEVMAVVADSKEELLEYMQEEVIDTEGASPEEILEAEEVFEVGDGRYLFVEA